MTSDSSRRGLLGALALVPIAAVTTAVCLLGRRPYDELSRNFPGIATALASGILNGIVAVAAVTCIGALVYGSVLRVRTGPGRLVADPRVDFGIVRWSSGVWALCAAALIAVDGAQNVGDSLALLARPGALGYLIQASYLPGAWIVVAIVAGFIFVVASFARSWMALAALSTLAAGALLAPSLVTQVLVGPNHDFGSDATIIGAPAEAAWFGATAIIAWRLWGRPRPAPTALARFRAFSVACWAVVVLTQLVVFFFELAGTSPLASPTGWLLSAQFALLAFMAAVALPALLRWREPESARMLVRTPRLAALLALMTAYLTIDVVRTRIPSPQFFAPTSITQLFFGYGVGRTPTLAVLAFDWRPSILFITMSVVAAGLYLFGVRRLRRRGDAWPVGRTVAWLAGWAVVLVTTSSGLGRYSSASFSLHMVLHMCLNMVGPLLMVLGGAVTLALRATTPHAGALRAGPHEWLTGLLGWRVTRAAYHPLWVFVRFVGSYYVLYLTPLFGQAIRYHWAHQVMNIEFIVVGYMFYGLVIGTDRLPRQLPPIGRLGLVLATMPFHAFFGVIVMTRTTVIAQLFYEYISVPWMHDLRADQYLGGGIAWAVGEVPLLVVVILLAMQWGRQDERQATRTDRHADPDPDDGYDVYTDVLAQLSTRVAAPAGAARSDDHEETA